MSPTLILRNLIYRYLKCSKPCDIGAFIMCYHSIGDNSWKHSIDFKEFKRQIDYLTDRYKIITLADIKKIICGTGINPRIPAFALNFDDGYKDILEVKEYLKNKGVRPVLFLLSNTKYSDKSQLENEKDFLSKEEVLSLIADGWEIGSHGATHKDFWNLNTEEIKEEIFDSKRILEETYGVTVKYFSYPRGRYTPEIVQAVKDAGYEMAVSMDDGKIEKCTDLFTLPRIGVDKTHGFDEFVTLMLEPVVMFRQYIKNFAGGVFRRFL